MTTTPEIGGVRVTAPLFRNAPEENLRAIVKGLQSASYHFADDSAKEWGAAHQCVHDAAALANQHRLGYRALVALYEDKPLLVSKGDWIDAVLSAARKASE